MAKGKRTRVLLDAWAGKGKERVKDNKRRDKILAKILKVSLDFVEVLSTMVNLLFNTSEFIGLIEIKSLLVAIDLSHSNDGVPAPLNRGIIEIFYYYVLQIVEKYGCLKVFI